MTPLLRYWTTLTTICVIIGSGIGIAFGGEIQDVFKKLDTAYMRQDAVALIRLAADLEGKDLWSFGGGGPTDTPSLRMRIYVVATDLMFRQGKETDVTVAKAEGKFSAAEQKVSALLQTDPQDAEAMRSLFESDDASQRWIGIYKAGWVTSPSRQLLQAAKKMALSDDFVVIAEAGSSQIERPKDFVAPLRQQAHEQLDKWKESVPENPANVAQAGWKRLLREYKARKDSRRDILRAIPLLSEPSQAMKTLPGMVAETTDEEEALSAFKKAATLK